LSQGHYTILVLLCHLTKDGTLHPTFRDIDAEDLATSFVTGSCEAWHTHRHRLRSWEALHLALFGDRFASLLGIKANLSMAITQRPTGRLNESTRSGTYLRIYINYHRTTGSNPAPCRVFIQQYLAFGHMVTPSSPTRDSTLNSKFLLNLLCRMLLTLLLQI